MSKNNLTIGQFNKRVEKYGFRPCGFLGYYNLPKPYDNRSVSVLNAGDRPGAWLAYLIAQWRKAEKE